MEPSGFNDQFILATFLRPRKYINVKERMKTIIYQEIKEYGSSLKEVSKFIEEEFHKSTGSIDNAYIERKYIKYCSEFWLKESAEEMKILIDNKNYENVQRIFRSLSEVTSLSNIDPFFQRHYYKILFKNYHLISKEHETALINQFKDKCLEQISSYSISVKKELKFLETFDDFLSNSRKLQNIVTKLQLRKFCDDQLSFDKIIKKILLLRKIDFGENLTVLQKAAKNLQNERNLFFIEEFQKLISAHLKPILISEESIDNRLVIEVTGRNVAISEVLENLECKLENSKVEEVRFIGASIIHIDKNLENKIWCGKNIVIFTKKLKLHGQITWNVSGDDNIHTYTTNAGQGEQGADGFPGESGGNVLVIVDIIENPENFTIISNGGMGSKGQNGGNGSDGKDGEGITASEFQEKFPTPCKVFCWNDARKETIINNIKNISRTIITNWDGDCDAYLEAISNRGSMITFSYRRGIFMNPYGAYLLYKGSPGIAGGEGGEYGLGGEGGYPGDIKIRNFQNSINEFRIQLTELMSCQWKICMYMDGLLSYFD
jgi:hypothetical protein